MKQTILAILATVALTVHGAVLMPGAIVAPANSPHPSDTGTQVAVDIGFYDSGDGHLAGYTAAQVFEGVAENPYGGLTFAYTVYTDPGVDSALKRISINGYKDFQVTAFQYDNGDGELWLLATRSPNGNTVGGLAHPISADSRSHILIFHTDAQMWTENSINYINGSVTSGLTYVPVIPEPHEYALVAGLGLVAFGCYRRFWEPKRLG